jgi:3-oxoacyl-[acyl-carrier protein] reductase
VDLHLQGKRALVTGASLGIGRAIAEELAREGCDVVLVARDAERLRQAADEIGTATNRKIVAAPGDGSRADSIADVVAAARASLGGIDILINNAGSTPEDGIDRVDFEKWQYSVSLKLFGYARFAQGVLPEMRARKWGRIVNIIGRSGHQPRPIYLAGGSINAGLLNLTKALAEECAKDNILVTGVNPGPIDTPRWRTLREAAVRSRNMSAAEFDARAAASTALARLGRSEEVAGIVAFLCSERASYITGEIINVDGGGTRCI